MGFVSVIKATVKVCLFSVAVASSAANAESYQPAPSYPDNVYWGDLHVHSNLSPDSYSFGNQNLGPGEALRFAKGEQVTAHNKMQVQLRRPLDFLMVSDHAEFLGVFTRLTAQDPELLGTVLGQRWNKYIEAGDQSAIMGEFVQFIQDPDYQQEIPASIRTSIWAQTAEIADEHNDPGNFTAFVGYEWTSMVNGNNLHRVVLYRDGADVAGQIPPFSSLDSQDPEDLWNWMAQYEESTGGEIMAIPHNGNLSNGLMFADTTLGGDPLDTEYAKQRSTWEPLYEVTQVKGDAEAHPLLSPDDEFADYENWDVDNIGRVQDKEPWMLQHEYARPALKRGLQWEAEPGVNPFKFGMIGSTDSHTTFATADDNNFFGKFPDSEPMPERTQNSMGGRLWYNWKLAASGYAAVWAEENTREALFDAMLKKEVYTTTGPRIVLRFFGGHFEEDDHLQSDFAAIGYAKGVPMGGSLSNLHKDQAPTFMISALKDPDGANLDRVQVVKGWLDKDGSLHEKIYDIAAADYDQRLLDDGSLQPVGSTVDVENASYTNKIGVSSLASVWQDPDFDPALRAMYYVRVLEIPTPRWTTYDAKYFNLKLDPEIPRVNQERVYSSPIWYSPD